MRGLLGGRQHGGLFPESAERMTESALAVIHRVMLIERVKVIDDVVLPRRGAEPFDPGSCQAIEPQRVACPPGDVVVGTRSIATDTDGPHFFAARVIERQAASEHMYAAHELPYQRILRGSVLRSISARISAIAVGDRRIDGIAELQAEQAPAGLNLSPEIRRGERIHRATGAGREVECRRCVGLLCRDHPASWPLADSGGAGK